MRVGCMKLTLISFVWYLYIEIVIYLQFFQDQIAQNSSISHALTARAYSIFIVQNLVNTKQMRSHTPYSNTPYYRGRPQHASTICTCSCPLLQARVCNRAFLSRAIFDLFAFWTEHNYSTAAIVRCNAKFHFMQAQASRSRPCGSQRCSYPPLPDQSPLIPPPSTLDLSQFAATIININLCNIGVSMAHNEAPWNLITTPFNAFHLFIKHNFVCTRGRFDPSFASVQFLNIFLFFTENIQLIANLTIGMQCNVIFYETWRKNGDYIIAALSRIHYFIFYCIGKLILPIFIPVFFFFRFFHSYGNF